MGVIDKDLGWAKILAETKKLSGAYTAVGYPGSVGGELHDTPLGRNGTAPQPRKTIAEVAMANNYGSVKDNVPARPFMTQAFDENQKEISKVVEALYGLVQDGKITAVQAVGRLGEWFTGVTKKKLTDGPWKENAQITIELKGSSTPLINTGQMRNSLTHKDVFK